MVVILDEKQMLPAPPPYAASANEAAPPFPGTEIQRPPANFESLSSSVVLYTIHTLIPAANAPGGVVRTRKILYWMTMCLRLVNKSIYIASMHVLRSTYLPAYLSMVRAPYTSDPFPLSSPNPSVVTTQLASPVNSLQRETQVLDLFLAAKVRDDVWADESELHLEREEAFQDLFDLMQPRARLEDLVRSYGVSAGVISTSAIVASSPVTSPAPGSSFSHSVRAPSASSSSSHTLAFPHPFPRPTPAKPHAMRRIPFSAMSCSFGPRSAGVILASKEGKKTIVTVDRTRGERLESTAKQLVKGLQAWTLRGQS